MRGADLRGEPCKLRKVPGPFVHLSLPPLRVNAKQFHQIRLWECESTEVELRLLWHRANGRLAAADAARRVIKKPEEWAQVLPISRPEVASVALTKPVHMGKDWRFTNLCKCGEPVAGVVAFAV
jgi:hypothetical protein